jgi:hypothetical protein
MVATHLCFADFRPVFAEATPWHGRINRTKYLCASVRDTLFKFLRKLYNENNT